MSTTLCDTFKKTASSTWTILSKARKVKSSLLEETLTDLNLLGLKVKHPSEIITKTFSKPAEGTVGADWEWWLTGPSHHWLGFRVQAKVLNLGSESYEHLHYKGKGSNTYQSDRLIYSALSHAPHLIPLYCLYSNWSGTRLTVTWPCGSFRRNVRSYGCGLVSAFIVRYLRALGQRNDIRSVLPYLRPWHCLVCCEGFGTGDLPQRAWAYWVNNLKESEKIVKTILEPGIAAEIDRSFSNVAPSYEEIRPSTEPPNYIIQLLDGLLVEQPDPALQRITIFREL